ncbi:MAG: methyltransferase [Granulosicoccus sp.]
MSVLVSPFGDFSLERWPASSDQSLRAWDAADELLMSHIHEHHQSALQSQARVLICNDAHGALGCALHAFNPIVWSDSCLAHSAIQKNWQRNALVGQADCLDSLSIPEGPFSLVLVKVPKTSALLEDQLARIAPQIDEHSIVIAASLVRHLHRTAFALFEKYIGEVTTSLAVKKSRLVFCSTRADRTVMPSPYPDSYTDTQLNITLLNHANVFCRDRVDIGARFFLSHTGQLPLAGRIIDLACGNGILGIHVQRLQPQAHLHFIDESYMAVASAQANYASTISSTNQAPVFTVGNGLEEVESDAADLILCNPPFHVQHAIADDTARSFFKQAARCLSRHGQLWVVANRHLRYRAYLKRYFEHCELVQGNSKFVLFKAWN